MASNDGIRVVLVNPELGRYTHVERTANKQDAIRAARVAASGGKPGTGWDEAEIESAELAPGAFGSEPAGVPVEEE